MMFLSNMVFEKVHTLNDTRSYEDHKLSRQKPRAIRNFSVAKYVLPSLCTCQSFPPHKHLTLPKLHISVLKPFLPFVFPTFVTLIFGMNKHISPTPILKSFVKYCLMRWTQNLLHSSHVVKGRCFISSIAVDINFFFHGRTVTIHWMALL